MLLKMGIDISRLRREVRRVLPDIDGYYTDHFGVEAVITSTCNDAHAANSLHYADLAIDIRLPPHDRAKTRDGLQQLLGDDFDVVLESTHIHIEYDRGE